MKKFIFGIIILVLIIITNLTKNSTKKIDAQIFQKKENIRNLTQQFEYILLDYNYLSSPEKLIEHQIQFFEEDLKPIRLENIKKILINNNQIEIFAISNLNE
tara:strand:- start:254 stop:559 length:306 start_codon:yes stop_codon:yes gene_type:complete